jgi:DNA-binding MarR family transcriptional regulator
MPPRPRQPSAAPADDPLASLLIQLAQTFIALGEEIAAQGRLTTPQWAVLHQVGDAGQEGATPSGIAASNGTSRPNVTKLVARLLRLGLLSSHPNPVDGREKRLTLTATGRRVLSALNGEKAGRIADALQGLSSAERGALLQQGRGLLHRLGARRLPRT